MSTAVMTRRAFDTRGNLADHLFRCLGTPYSDVLEHNTVSPTREVHVESRFRRDPRPALFLFSELSVTGSATHPGDWSSKTFRDGVTSR